MHPGLRRPHGVEGGETSAKKSGDFRVNYGELYLCSHYRYYLYIQDIYYNDEKYCI